MVKIPSFQRMEPRFDPWSGHWILHAATQTQCHQINKIVYFLKIFLQKIKKTIKFFIVLGFPSGSDDKESACNTGDPGSVPGLGRSSGEENGNPLQYSCLENSMDRRAWWATDHGVTNSQTHLSD